MPIPRQGLDKHDDKYRQYVRVTPQQQYVKVSLSISISIRKSLIAAAAVRQGVYLYQNHAHDDAAIGQRCTQPPRPSPHKLGCARVSHMCSSWISCPRGN